jgi:hypothetical protein
MLERGIAMGLDKAGQNPYQISKQLDCSHQSIRGLKKKVASTKSLSDAKRSGRPRKTSPREDRTMKFKSLKDRKLTGTAMALQQCPTFTKNRISVTTARSRLRVHGLNGRVARKKPLLTDNSSF